VEEWNQNQNPNEQDALSYSVSLLNLLIGLISLLYYTYYLVDTSTKYFGTINCSLCVYFQLFHH